MQKKEIAIFIAFVIIIAVLFFLIFTNVTHPDFLDEMEKSTTLFITKGLFLFKIIKQF